jgi:hypothetical protein
MKNITVDPLLYHPVHDELDYRSTQHKMLQDVSLKVKSGLDKQIIERLKEHGHEFETLAEFAGFVTSSRCSITINSERHCSFFVDGELIATWYDNYDTKMEHTHNGMKVTLTYGAPTK